MRSAAAFLMLCGVLLSVRAATVALDRRFNGVPPDPEQAKTDPISWPRIATARYYAYLEYSLEHKPAAASGQAPSTAGAAFSLSAQETKALEEQKKQVYPYFEQRAPPPKPLTCADAGRAGYSCRDLSDVQAGTAWVGEYNIVGYIKSGAFGSTYLSSKGGQYYAAKIEWPGARGSDDEPFSPTAFTIPKSLTDGGVTGVIQSFAWSQKPEAVTFITSPATTNQLLKVYSKEAATTVENIKFAVYTMVSSLASVHEKGVTIRDISPKTIEVGLDKEPRFVEFSLSRTTDGMFNKHAGACKYLAPEVLKEVQGKAPKAVTNYKPVDVYALGRVFAEMMTSQPAGPQPNYCTIDFKVVPGLDDLGKKDATIAGIIGGMLNTDPAKRLTAAQVAAQVKAWTPK